MIIELPKWYDLHAHFRQGEFLEPLITDHRAMGCAGILAMPNTKPPVAKVHESDEGDVWSIEGYLVDLCSAGGDAFDDIIIPLYLTANMSAAMIEEGAKNGLLRAAKYYPPHGTTGAQNAAPFEHFMCNGVFAAMEEAGVVLCIHGEEYGLEAEEYFDRKHNAEELFYTNHMPQLVERFPKLKIVGEHLTTKVGVDFILSAPDHVTASITPQHLLYTVGHLLKGLKYHLYCLPLLKFEEDRAALRDAVISPNNRKFFAGTDSAPHTVKATSCGCAAGCYTGAIAPQLYAQAFEEAGVDLASNSGAAAFKRFLCTNGAEFYGLPISQETFTLEKVPQELIPTTIGDAQITPLPLGMNGSATISWRIV